MCREGWNEEIKQIHIQMKEGFMCERVVVCEDEDMSLFRQVSRKGVICEDKG